MSVQNSQGILTEANDATGNNCLSDITSQRQDTSIPCVEYKNESEDVAAMTVLLNENTLQVSSETETVPHVAAKTEVVPDIAADHEDYVVTAATEVVQDVTEESEIVPAVTIETEVVSDVTTKTEVVLDTIVKTEAIPNVPADIKNDAANNELTGDVVAKLETDYDVAQAVEEAGADSAARQDAQIEVLAHVVDSPEPAEITSAENEDQIALDAGHQIKEPVVEFDNVSQNHSDVVVASNLTLNLNSRTDLDSYYAEAGVTSVQPEFETCEKVRQLRIR